MKCLSDPDIIDMKAVIKNFSSYLLKVNKTKRERKLKDNKLGKPYAPKDR